MDRRPAAADTPGSDVRFDLGCQQCPYGPRCQFLPKPFRLREALSLVGDALAQPSSN